MSLPEERSTAEQVFYTYTYSYASTADAYIMSISRHMEARGAGSVSNGLLAVHTACSPHVQQLSPVQYSQQHNNHD